MQTYVNRFVMLQIVMLQKSVVHTSIQRKTAALRSTNVSAALGEQTPQTLHQLACELVKVVNICKTLQVIARIKRGHNLQMRVDTKCQLLLLVDFFRPISDLLIHTVSSCNQRSNVKLYCKLNISYQLCLMSDPCFYKWLLGAESRYRETCNWSYKLHCYGHRYTYVFFSFEKGSIIFISRNTALLFTNETIPDKPLGAPKRHTCHERRHQYLLTNRLFCYSASVLLKINVSNIHRRKST